MVEMHEFGRVMRQFGFRQTIPPSPKTSKHCTRSICEEELMKICLNSMGNISTFESIDITASHIFCRKRQGLGNVVLGGQDDPHINPRSGVYASMDSSSAPTQHEAPRAIPPLGRYVFCTIFVLSTILHTNANNNTDCRKHLQHHYSTVVAHLRDDLLMEWKTYDSKVRGHHTQPRRKEMKTKTKKMWSRKPNLYKEICLATDTH
ncbi:hypothetical protein Gotur_015027 [Gossypium turneri]